MGSWNYFSWLLHSDIAVGRDLDVFDCGFHDYRLDYLRTR